MATISGTQGYWEVSLTVTESGTSAENNTSSAYWELWIARTYASEYPMAGTPTINIKISGKSAYSDSPYFNISSITDKGVKLLSGTVSGIEHDDKGVVKSDAISFTWSGSGFSPSSVSASGKYSTTTIPRASSISVSNYNLGQNISIAIGKKVSSFTSTLTYKIGSRTGTIATKTSISPYVWEMSSTLIKQIKQDNPKNKKVSAIVYCDTYSGDTKIGATQSATFELTIVDKPTIDNVSIVETIELIKQYTTSIMKYLSVPKFNITAIPSEGTTISKYRVKIDEKEFTSSSNELTVNNIQYSYLVNDVRKTKFIVTVIDARGNTSEEKPIEMDFIEYVQLAFNNTDITLTRLNGTSNFVKLHLSGYVYNNLIGETENILTLQYRYKLKNDTTAEWSELKNLTPTLNEDNTFTIEDLQLEEEFDYRENYDIEFYAQDLFLSIIYKTVVKTSETIAKWHKNGAYIKEITCEKADIFPVGSIYIATKDFNPNNYFFGTWEQIKDTFLLASGDSYKAGSTGGEASHTLTLYEMPSHGHGQRVGCVTGGTKSINADYTEYSTTGSVVWQGADTYNTGGGAAHNNMPPYLAVYVWERVE